MKTRRHEKILELISSSDIDTQEELMKALASSGFDVTQATISRDIKELRLIKTLSSTGKYKYSTGKSENTDMSAKFYMLFADSVTDVTVACNLVVIQTVPGMAQAVCAAMDQIKMQGRVGTIAGEDTIFIACSSDAAGLEIAEELSRFLKR